MYNQPGLPRDSDPRTPDIIVQPNVGVIYTGRLKKQAEHGGFVHDNTNVMLLISNSRIKAKTITSFLATTQVAYTILSILGLEPKALTVVQAEGTPVLPGFEGEQDPSTRCNYHQCGRLPGVRTLHLVALIFAPTAQSLGADRVIPVIELCGEVYRRSIPQLLSRP
jgi:hypothetical protein